MSDMRSRYHESSQQASSCRVRVARLFDLVQALCVLLQLSLSRMIPLKGAFPRLDMCVLCSLLTLFFALYIIDVLHYILVERAEYRGGVS